MRHDQTPTDKRGRGALWWLKEHAEAERAVTSAWTLEGGPMSRERFERELDRRMDHLELVDTICDRIIEALAAESPELAEAAKAVYLEGETLRAVARRQGVGVGTLHSRLERAAARVACPHVEAVPDSVAPTLDAGTRALAEALLRARG